MILLVPQAYYWSAMTMTTVRFSPFSRLIGTKERGNILSRAEGMKGTSQKPLKRSIVICRSVTISFAIQVGYGDVFPVSAEERTFAVLAMIIGALIFGSVFTHHFPLSLTSPRIILFFLTLLHKCLLYHQEFPSPRKRLHDLLSAT